MKYGLALGAFLLMAGSAAAEPLHLLTEDYPPFNFRDDGKLRGISVEQVETIMKGAGIAYRMELQPWARAFTLAETTPDTCVFTTSMLPERIPRFKWVQPLVLDTMVLVRKAGSPVQPRNIEEAKTFSIGVHKDDSAETFAQNQGFQHLDSAPSLDLSVKKLVSSRVDMVMMQKTSYQALRQGGQPIETVMSLEATRAGIACNRDVPDTTIAAMQRQLDIMLTSGVQADIYRRYGQETN